MRRDDPSTTAGAFTPDDVTSFTYVGWDLEATDDALTLRCTYTLHADPRSGTADVSFTEVIGIATATASTALIGTDTAAVEAAARLVFLLAGVSYFKAAAPPVVVADPAAGGLSPAERALLWAHHVDGLGEFAFRNNLDLGGLRLEATTATPAAPQAPPDHPRRPLIPFGGGIDSIATVEGVRAVAPAADAALFVLSRPHDHFAAIEAPLAVTGHPVVRAWRSLDPKILESAARGYRNGHVPVTGILSAVALLAAAVDGRDAVVMSNEWSASAPNLTHAGRDVNHQWSKSLAFEDLLRSVLATSPLAGVNYHSWLRPRSELWVARQFATLDRYHPVFRSCNRSFTLDPDRRLDRWCGTCDKCCFIDLILAPYVSAEALADVFGGTEPLADETLRLAFDALCGLSADAKPFECVGDVDECRVATALAADRPDRADDRLVAALAAGVADVVPGDPADHAATLLAPLGPHNIPAGLAPTDLPPAQSATAPHRPAESSAPERSA